EGNAMRCCGLPERTIRSSSCLASGVTAIGALLAHMPGSLTSTNHIVKLCMRHYTSAIIDLPPPLTQNAGSRGAMPMLKVSAVEALPCASWGQTAGKGEH